MSDLLGRLKEHLVDDLEGLTLTEDGLRAVADLRYGEVMLAVDHDTEAASVRVSVDLAPAAGAGPEFLVFCLATNVQYWDVKLGLDDEGQLVVHSDLDAVESTDPKLLAAMVMDRVENICDMIDTDLVAWLLDHNLGTPNQRARWIKREKDPTGD
jgi:hypothetical protein